jgi:hypothetical protein
MVERRHFREKFAKGVPKPEPDDPNECRCRAHQRGRDGPRMPDPFSVRTLKMASLFASLERKHGRKEPPVPDVGGDRIFAKWL